MSLTSSLRFACLAALVTIGGDACADEMFWSWAHDAPDGRRLRPGDVVTIELWAEWSVGNGCYGHSLFSIYDHEGGETFFGGGSSVNIDEAQGLGRYQQLSALSGDNGILDDSDGDGAIDRIDHIDTFVLPAFFGYCVMSPTWVYRMEWTVGNTLGWVDLGRGATSSGDFFNSVYYDTFGTLGDVDPIDESLRLRVVPGQGGVAVIGCAVGVGCVRRRR